jgi:recombination protein RecR
MYPKQFDDLIAAFSTLPSIGTKSAERIAFAMMDWDQEKIDSFISAFEGLKKLKRCEICHNISDSKICSICSDENRDRSTICVVQTPKDIYSIEAMEEYDGLYHVLDGTINIQKGILPESLNIESLEKRITPEINEVILALDPTIDGELTAKYITGLLDKKVNITQLASGIPVGSRLDYADQRTLSKAFKGRK